MRQILRTTTPRRAGRGLEGKAFICALAAIALAVLTSVHAPAPARAAEDPPVLAYYYIWFDHGSWDRAKKDLPLLGNYSSDDRAVVRQHVAWAREAGLDGFIVSWKHTPSLDRRLRLVAEEAKAGGLSLSVIYQGLDFHRVPLPVDRVRGDFVYFADTFANDPTFVLDGRPTVVLNGTWRFSAAEIASITGPVRSKLRVLASEKNPGDYARVASAVDGNSYYWSSGDPLTTAGHAEKLREFADVVRAGGGFWIAPATAGYDGQLLGGDRVVERRGGETLRRGFAAARASTPDAIGVISWNEFSENSHIEPSEVGAMASLETLHDILGASAPLDPPEELTPSAAGPQDDGSGEASAERSWGGVAALAAMGLLLVAAFAWAINRRPGPDPGVGEGEANNRQQQQ